MLPGRMVIEVEVATGVLRRRNDDTDLGWMGEYNISSEVDHQKHLANQKPTKLVLRRKKPQR
jgi:hypothetical protein